MPRLFSLAQFCFTYAVVLIVTQHTQRSKLKLRGNVKTVQCSTLLVFLLAVGDQRKAEGGREGPEHRVWGGGEGMAG